MVVLQCFILNGTFYLVSNISLIFIPPFYLSHVLTFLLDPNETYFLRFTYPGIPKNYQETLFDNHSD
jgi:hypothetical protein